MVIVNYAAGIHSKQINLSKLAKYIRVQMGVHGWVDAGGHHSSVAKHWRLQPETLGSTPGSATFTSCPGIALPSQRSMESGGTDCVFRLDTHSIGL